jgi:hypothetical protein
VRCGFLASALVLLLPFAAPTLGAAPVPTHLFPRVADPVVPGLLFAWSRDGDVWVVARVDGGKVLANRADGTETDRTFRADEVRRAFHYGPEPRPGDPGTVRDRERYWCYKVPRGNWVAVYRCSGQTPPSPKETP